MEIKYIKPQEGPQQNFLENESDLILFGGSAGGGKTYALLLDLLWYHDVPGFTAIIFRRTSPQITSQGGLWSSSQELFRKFGGEPNQTTLEWKFPSGATIKFSHMQHEKDKFSHQGSAICGLYWDELTHFTRDQFFYMLSRNRSTCGIKPYVKMTCNPDADSWVRYLVDWYINPVTGLAIPERSGVTRWFIVRDDTMIWANTESELKEKYPGCLPKSFTFISASIYDNQKLLQIDKGYLANLEALPKVERERLLHGNWNIKPTSGLYFKSTYFDIINAKPIKTKKIRYWDRASTRKTADNDPDYTVGLKLEKDDDGILYITDLVRIQESPLEVQKAIKQSAILDGIECQIGLEQDPGQAGAVEIDYLIRQLQGFTVTPNKVSTDKVTRAGPVSSQAEAGNIKILKASWNEPLIRELENFPEGAHDDCVDALSGAFTLMNRAKYDINAMIKW